MSRMFVAADFSARSLCDVLKILALEGGESVQNAKNTSKRTFNSPRAVRPSKASSFSSSFLYDDQSLSSLPFR